MRICLAVACALAASAGNAWGSEAGTASGAGAPFAVIDRVHGPDGGGWDYTTVDEHSHRLFLGRDAGILSLELETRKITPVFVPGAGTHGAFLAGDTGLAVSTNGDKKTASVFETSTGKVLGEVAVGEEPDAAVFEPKSGWVAVINHKGGTVSLVDVHARKVVGTVTIGGELEFAAAAGDGRIFLNVADKHLVAVVDVPGKKLVKKFPLTGCTDPSGLAYDAADQMVISVCANGVTKFIQAADGKEIASLATGKGSDGVIFDAGRRLVFVPAGRDGTLSIVSVEGGKPAVVQKLETQKGARLGALDPGTGRVYLPTAQLGPPVPPEPWPSVKPGTFEFLIVGQK